MPKGVFERKPKEQVKSTQVDIIINEWLHDCTYGKLMDRLEIANPKLFTQLSGMGRVEFVKSGLY